MPGLVGLADLDQLVIEVSAEPLEQVDSIVGNISAGAFQPAKAGERHQRVTRYAALDQLPAELLRSHDQCAQQHLLFYHRA